MSAEMIIVGGIALASAGAGFLMILLGYLLSKKQMEWRDPVNETLNQASQVIQAVKGRPIESGKTGEVTPGQADAAKRAFQNPHLR